MEQSHIKPGVGVLLRKEGKYLFGERIGGNLNSFASPGGHVEFGETLEDACKREVLEETGLIIKRDPVLLTIANILWPHGKQYIDFGFLAEWESGEPELREPNKCAGWNWYGTDNLPKPFLPTDRLKLDALSEGGPYPKYLGTLKF